MSASSIVDIEELGRRIRKLRADRIARADVERMRNAVTSGKTAQRIESGQKRRSGSIATGGKGVAAQCVADALCAAIA